MRKAGLMLIALCATALPAVAFAQSGPQPRRMGPTPMEADVDAGKVFQCEGDRRLVARFDTQNDKLVAIIDFGEGPVTLPILPWDGGEPRVTWSDGPRTLVWTSGVKLMFTDEDTHLMCGRHLGEAHH